MTNTEEDLKSSAFNLHLANIIVTIGAKGEVLGADAWLPVSPIRDGGTGTSRREQPVGPGSRGSPSRSSTRRWRPTASAWISWRRKKAVYGWAGRLASRHAARLLWNAYEVAGGTFVQIRPERVHPSDSSSRTALRTGGTAP